MCLPWTRAHKEVGQDGTLSLGSVKVSEIQMEIKSVLYVYLQSGWGKKYSVKRRDLQFRVDSEPLESRRRRAERSGFLELKV